MASGGPVCLPDWTARLWTVPEAGHRLCLWRALGVPQRAWTHPSGGPWKGLRLPNKGGAELGAPSEVHGGQGSGRALSGPAREVGAEGGLSAPSRTSQNEVRLPWDVKSHHALCLSGALGVGGLAHGCKLTDSVGAGSPAVDHKSAPALLAVPWQSLGNSLRQSPADERAFVEAQVSSREVPAHCWSKNKN